MMRLALAWVGCGVLLLGCGGKVGQTGDSGVKIGDGGGQGDLAWNGGTDGGSHEGGMLRDLAVCAQSSAAATLESRPVDIVFVIDNSGSMSAEIAEVEKQINQNFAKIIDSAVPPVDYRVIMLSSFGDNASQRICVAAPLGGIPDADGDGHCDTLPSKPVNTAKFFHHSVKINSHDALCKLTEYFGKADGHGLQPGGYQDVLRPEAFKFLAVVTDDGVSCGAYNDSNSVDDGDKVAPAFDADLLKLSPEHFGKSAEARNYSFWSIVALAPHQPTAQKPYGDPHPPDSAAAPVITAKCTPSAVDPGTGYQALSIRTGGYRYPTCGLDYTDIFKLMAQGVILGAQVACEFEIPDPPEGEKLDLKTVQVRYASAGKPVQTFNAVASKAACSPGAHGFYIEDNRIKLCPATCVLVQADDKAELSILYGCALPPIK